MKRNNVHFILGETSSRWEMRYRSNNGSSPMSSSKLMAWTGPVLYLFSSVTNLRNTSTARARRGTMMTMMPMMVNTPLISWCGTFHRPCSQQAEQCGQKLYFERWMTMSNTKTVDGRDLNLLETFFVFSLFTGEGGEYVVNRGWWYRLSVDGFDKMGSSSDTARE